MKTALIAGLVSIATASAIVLAGMIASARLARSMGFRFE